MSGDVTPNDWRELESLIDRVLDAPREARAAVLAELSAADPARRAELERLVAECERAYPLLDRPVAERFGALLESETMRVPQVLADRYRIVRELGRGGMAVVYLAHDVKHDRDVAVKIVRPELAATLGRARFLREIAIAAKLRHPHIVPLFDSGEVDGLLFYVMPYQEEQSLRERLTRDEALPIDDAIAILSDVCDALAYAHRQGVVHRDIKPDNILLAGRHALVTDFGVARAVTAASEQDTLTTAGGVVGTAAYMAPEQQSAHGPVDHRVDIYAVGVMAYEMLAGERPFSGDTPPSQWTAQSAKVAFDLTRLRREVPPALAALVVKSLAKDPAERYQNSEEILAALDSVASGSVTRAGIAHGRLTRLTRSLRDRRWATLAIAVVAIAAGGALGLRQRAQNQRARLEATRRPLTIGILPVTAASPAGELDWLSKGLPHQLSLELNGVPGLMVHPTESIAALLARGWPLDSIALVRDLDYLVRATLSHGGRDSVEVALELIEGGIRPVQPGSTQEPLLGDNVLRTVGRHLAERLRPMLGARVRERQLEAAPTNARALQQRRMADHYRLLIPVRVDAQDVVGAQRALDSADALLIESQRLDSRWVAPRLTRARLSSWRVILVMLKPGDTDYVGVRRVFNAGIAIVDSVLETAPEDAVALALRGHLRRERTTIGGEDAVAVKAAMDSAQRDLEEALRIDTLLAQPSADLSEIMFRARRFHDAAKYAERAYSVDSYLENASEIINLLALSKLEINEDAEAARWCAEGMRRFPDDYPHHSCALDVMAWGSGPTSADSAWLHFREVERGMAGFDVAGKAKHLAAVAAVLARSPSVPRDSSARVLQRARDLVVTNPNVTHAARVTFLASEAAVLYRLGEIARASNLIAEIRRQEPVTVDLLLQRRSLRAFVPPVAQPSAR